MCALCTLIFVDFKNGSTVMVLAVIKSVIPTYIVIYICVPKDLLDENIDLG